MVRKGDSTTQLQHWLNRMRGGDKGAQEALLQHSLERLREMARTKLYFYPAVHRWEQTDDVLQNALLRLHRALAKVQPETVHGFLGLAAKLIRQELIDLGRHYFGPQGIGANHASGADLTEAHGKVENFTRLQELVEGLPVDQRDVVDLISYHCMTQAEAAVHLGISKRTVSRRYRDAMISLREQLRDDAVFE